MKPAEQSSAQAGEMSRRKGRVLKSPLIYLIATLYAGVVAGAFLASIEEISDIDRILDKMAFLGFSFVFFINASSMILFYIYSVSPLETKNIDHAMSAAITLIFVTFYLLAFLILPRGWLAYGVGLIGLGVVYALTWTKYQMIFRKLRTALTRDSTDDRALENNRSMENLLSAYFFARILQRNMSRTGQASLSGFVLGIVILLGRIIPKVPVGAEDSWLLSSMVTAFALYMIVVVVWNVAQILNPDVLEEFERSGDEFLAKYSIN